MLRYSTDGGQTWVETTELRLQGPKERTGSFDVNLVFTEEGMVKDTWRGDELLNTECTFWDDLLMT